MRIGLASNSGLFASGYQRLLDMGATAWVEPTCTQTIQQADGVNPDVTTWNKSPAGMGATGGQADPDGGNNAYLITDTVDGGGVFHSITDTTPNAQPGYVRRVVWLKAGTQNYSYVMGGTSGGTSNASIFNITGAAATYNQGSGVGRHLEFVGDWRKFLFTETPDAAMRARNIPVQAGTTNQTTYQGAGTGTFYLYSPAGSYQQDRVSSLTSRGTGYIFSQATDANRPIVHPDGFNDKPALWFGGASAPKCLAGDPLAAAFDFRDDFTIVTTIQWHGAAGAEEWVWCAGTAGTSMQGLKRNAAGTLQTVWTDYAGAPTTYDHGVATGQQVVSVSQVTVGAVMSRAIYVNGVLSAGGGVCAMAVDASLLTLGAAATGVGAWAEHGQFMQREWAFIPRALSAVEHRQAYAIAKSNAGIA